MLWLGFVALTEIETQCKIVFVLFGMNVYIGNSD